MRLGTVRLRHGDHFVHTLAFSPDGKLLATGAARSVHVWEANTCKRLAQFEVAEVNKTPGFILRFVRDDRTLAALTYQRRLHVWQMADRNQVADIEVAPPEGPLPDNFSAQFSPDGSTLAVAYARKGSASLDLLDVCTGKKVRRLETPQYVEVLACSPAGRLVAARQSKGKLQLWHTGLGKVRALPGSRVVEGLVTFSPDSKHLALCGFDRTIHLWDLASGKHRDVPGPPPGRWQLTDAAFAPDGHTLILKDPGRVQLIDVRTGKTLRTLNDEKWRMSRAALSPDGKTLAVGGCVARLLDLATGKDRIPVRGHTKEVRAVCFAPDGRTLVSTSEDGSMRLWDVTTGKELRRWESLQPVPDQVAFSRGGASLLMSDVYGDLREWDVTTGKELRRFDSRQTSRFVLSPDGKHLATADGDGTLRYFDLHSGKERSRFVLPGREKGGRRLWGDLAFAPDGRHILVGVGHSLDRLPLLDKGLKQLYFWEMQSGKIVHSFLNSRDHDLEGVRAVAVSASGLLAAVVQGSRVRFWDAQTGQLVRRFQGRNPEANRLAFSPDGKFLALVWGWPAGVWLWDTLAAAPVHTFRGHGGSIQALAFSADGRALATAGSDTSILIWDVLPPAAAADANPAENKLARLWDALAGEPAAAFRAQRVLLAAPLRAIPFLERRLRATDPEARKERIEGLVADLNSRRFGTRVRASQELLRLGSRAVPAVRSALQGKPSLEARRRLETLLEELEDVARQPDRLRVSRAIAVLESFGTTAARQALGRLTRGE
jgi:WD40 repeat protein